VRERTRGASAGSAPGAGRGPTCSTARCGPTCSSRRRQRRTRSWSPRCAGPGWGDWYAALPDGLDTLVGEHGGTVSGGERQRLGVARALLADRPVLLFDEPTAHLDPATADVLASELLGGSSRV
jgi:hypothetical protein